MKVGILGMGRVGATIALALRDAAGVSLPLMYDRATRRAAELRERFGLEVSTGPLEPGQVGVDLLLLAVPDGEIPSSARAISGIVGRDTVVAHLAGAFDLGPLAAVRQVAAAVGVLHPLRAITDPLEQRVSLGGCAFTVEASSPGGFGVLERLVEHLGGRCLRLVPGARASYHAAAAIAANGVTAALAEAAAMMSRALEPSGEAMDVVLDLARGALERVERLGPAKGLTGPVARGDAATVERHLAALAHEPSLGFYKALSAAALELARPNLTEEQTRRLEDLLGVGRGSGPHGRR